MPRGGRRAGAGRKLGSKDRLTRLAEILPRLAEPERQLPLYRLLDRIGDETLDPKYRDMLAIAVLPYLHARLPPVLTAKPAFMMSDHELAEVQHAQLEHERQVTISRGKVSLIKAGA